MSAVQVFRHEAMATEWEVVIAQEAVTPQRARATAAAVFAEVDRLEGELSRFRPTSDLWRLSLAKPGEAVIVDFAALDCLSLAKAVHAETGGAFDVTLGPLMRLWRNKDGSERVPRPEEIAAAQERVGMDKFEIDPDGQRVVVHVTGMVFDLGAVGKGYALDQAVRVLEEHEIRCALLNAGESTLLGIGHAPETEHGWPIDLHLEPPQTVCLAGDALSCSGFAVQGAHIIDPRTLAPVPVEAKRSYVQAPTAALSDALSTAFMVMDAESVQAFLQRHTQVAAFMGMARD